MQHGSTSNFILFLESHFKPLHFYIMIYIICTWFLYYWETYQNIKISHCDMNIYSMLFKNRLSIFSTYLWIQFVGELKHLFFLEFIGPTKEIFALWRNPPEKNVETFLSVKNPTWRPDIYLGNSLPEFCFVSSMNCWYYTT